MRVAILGGGVTGLAAGSVSGFPVFEQSVHPGGLCRSYYFAPGASDPRPGRPVSDDCYRFEVGGGHWIFGAPPDRIAWLRQYADCRVYERRAAVRIGSLGLTVPYPLQAHVEGISPELASRVRGETAVQAGRDPGVTLRDWLEQSFGPSLCDLFFVPFHDRYTAGLTESIAPQDLYKTPRHGATGYNSSFLYPAGGLDQVTSRLAAQCDVRYGKAVTRIDIEGRTVHFADGDSYPYDRLISTLPLHRASQLAGVVTDEEIDPYTSVLVLNVGAERGPACPDCHWQYEPDSGSGFHRIGFYSNVEPEFLPARRRGGTHVSMYVERSYPGGYIPDEKEVAGYTGAVIAELQDREYIGAVEAVHPSWVEVAYTWRRPGSGWPEEASSRLAQAGITQIGRYGRWHFQGLADSLTEGLEAGSSPDP